MNVLVLIVGLLALSSTEVKGQVGVPVPVGGFRLLEISVVGDSLETRIHCSVTVNCTGLGDNVFWSFFGSSFPLAQTDTRVINTTSFTTIEGDTVILSQLTFSPVEEDHQETYTCQVQGDEDFSLSLDVLVDTVPLEIISEIPNIDLSNKTVGDSITIICQVDTCVSTVMVFLYKDDNPINNTVIMGNTMTSVSAAFPLTVQLNTAGRYACKASALDTITPLTYFNITGVPIQPSISISSTPATTTTTTTTTTSTVVNQQSSSQGMTSANQPGTRTRTMTVATATTSMTPTPTGGGAAGQVVEWTLLLSLVLVTFVSSLLVW